MNWTYPLRHKDRKPEPLPDIPINFLEILPPEVVIAKKKGQPVPSIRPKENSAKTGSKGANQPKGYSPLEAHWRILEADRIEREYLLNLSKGTNPNRSTFNELRKEP